MVRTYSKVVLAALMCGGLIACSSSDSGGGGGDKYGNRQIDTSNFKNSASEGEFKKKGDSVDEYFSDLSEVKNTFMASGAGNSIAVAFKAMMADEGDVSAEPINAPEACDTVYTEETTPEGDWLDVETTTCVTEADGKKTTCVETVKKKWGEIVSTGKSCESSQSTTTTTTTTTSTTTIGGGASDQYLPSFDDVKDCEDAFGAFEKTYQGVKTEFDNVYGMLMSPDGLSLAGSGLTDAGELEKIENDDKSAITYKITAPTQGGFKASGTISGGANETTLLLRQKLKVSFDLADMMSQSGSTGDASINPPPSGSEQPEQPTMPSMQMAIDTDGTIAVDTTRKLIEQDIDMTMVIGMDDQSSTSTAKGRIAVSAGDEKFVTVKMDVGVAAADQKMAANVNMETRLVDDNTLTFRATMNGDQAGEMLFDLVRNAEGKCEVKNEKNTMPKVEQAQTPPVKK